MKSLSVKAVRHLLRISSLAVAGRNLLVAVILAASLNAYLNMIRYDVDIPGDGTTTELSLNEKDVAKFLPFTIMSSGVISKFVYLNGQ